MSRALQPAFVVTVAISAVAGCRAPASPAARAASTTSTRPQAPDPATSSAVVGAPPPSSASAEAERQLSEEEATHLFDGPDVPVNRVRHPSLCRDSEEQRRTHSTCMELHPASSVCRGHITKYALEDGSFECVCFESRNPPRVFAMYCPAHVLERED